MVNAKKDLLLSLLAQDWAYVVVDGRQPGVDLPDWLREPEVTLQIGYDMPLPIPDLAIDDDGVTATLSFQRTPHRCRLPWTAVIAIASSDGRGLRFEPSDDVTPTVQEPPLEPPAQPPAPETPPGKKPRPPYLKLV
jgi:stringent starvation protein B